MSKAKLGQRPGQKTGLGSELGQRLLFVIAAIIIYRLGTYIPIPGMNMADIQDAINNRDAGDLSAFANLFSGGAIERMSIFALGVMPYISASIVIQLLSHMPGKLKDLRQSGTQGRRKILQYTRYLTLAVAFFQGVALCLAFQERALYAGPAFWLVGGFTFACGAMFLMWLGEQINERGIGNGISILILAGIVASMPSVFGGLVSSAKSGDVSTALVLAIFAIIVALFVVIVFVETSQRRIPIHYARQQTGMAMGQNAPYLPLKVNLAGVIPVIFATAIIILIGAVLSFMSNLDVLNEGLGGSFTRYMGLATAKMQSGQPIYILIFGLLIVAFTFFYTGLVFENKELADDLKKSGAFIQGVRPGKATADYIDHVQSRLTMVGAIYLAGVVLLPEVFNMNQSNSVLLQFGGASILIIVVVIMDLVQKIQAMRMSTQYESLMKKSHLGRKRT
ncbi:preprotein translocase subunit SecY [Ostreibacterium oceani]|uniref:Protein translocase subunit SecY n=1 Tax=Ostreibacterium oceani TaxID=2654998 RepID=A0A6N7EW16_9GAMM|nr:preprotein translocase subunit SecY [Ostreibacterium oceani]MPV85750.1 preprotein translocase subunit SecY [Ostreibacterium oceani]